MELERKNLGSQDAQQEFRKIQRFLLTYHRASSLQKSLSPWSLFSPRAMCDFDQNPLVFSDTEMLCSKILKQSQSLETHLGCPENGFRLDANPDSCEPKARNEDQSCKTGVGALCSAQHYNEMPSAAGDSAGTYITDPNAQHFRCFPTAHVKT